MCVLIYHYFIINVGFDILNTDYGEHLVKHLAVAWNLGHFHGSVRH